MMPAPSLAEPGDDVEQALDLASVSDAVGSSMMMTAASAPIAFAISTSCCSGMLSVPTSRSGAIGGADAPEQFGRARGGAPASPRAATVPPLDRERDVLGHRQVREERRLLVDRGDAERARGRPGRAGGGRGPECRASRRRRLRAGDDPDQRRLAGAVLADEGVHLAGPRSNDTPFSARTPANDLAIAVTAEEPSRARGGSGAAHASTRQARPTRLPVGVQPAPA